ncbi:type II CRISPR RNA-guided endonuclease Cas9 [Microbaculum marinisediminis]|uniref:CRISPR-associated endonuclease Cas9 n=1 Tax=Microbaculum marinisediminis TaxID=2931392 RepID=A0AAW5QXY2_9HYPH|nr:type II CRISPR RNA-guided endonuclease Cas9 [Microbaculum sp. A6E488]MCT8972921.1 type II CRISPR RNA-guided endonuclease Cas9 [Microbaculum sp. A6E488]
MTIPYRLGLDLGTNSIGWCALRLDAGGKPCGVLDAGVRILTPNEEAGRDPQSKASLAGDRRAARAMRRRRDRFLRRQKRLMRTLVDAGLMPADTRERKALETLDPYWLRAAALDQPLEPHELGRAIFHLNQRRGFKSNRIANSDDREKGATKTGIRALETALADSGARTLGELLARRHRRDKHGNRLGDGDGFATPDAVRFRPHAEGTKVLYDFYPSRDMIELELDRIWAAQEPHHPQLTDDLLARLKRIIVGQRPLKKPVVGRCTLRPEPTVIAPFGFEIDLGERAPKAHPLFQRFRILQDVGQLRVSRAGQRERHLTMQERDAIAAQLMANSGSMVDFDKLRKKARLPDDARFNYELAGRKGFQPDQTAARLAAKKAFGKTWRSLPRDRQAEVVERLLAMEDEGQLEDWLVGTFGLNAETAEAISGTRLPQGHGQFGRSVLADLVHAMEEKGAETHDPATGEVYLRPLTYDEAVREIGLHHSDLRPGEKAARLPYYGEALVRHVISKPDAPEGSQEGIGRVPNPTVHIGLNQLRKLVNALIAVHGPPAEIVVELARELKLNKKRRDDIQRENRENEKANDRRRAELEALGYADTHGNRLLLRLYEELPADERVCVYSGTPISREMLFDGSVDIDHILPYSKTLDDGFMNKVLCTRRANREKGNRPPADVWSGDALQEIVERAERLFGKKAWRFQPDAMSRFDAEGGFIARQLTDTQHMARLAKTYLEQVCDQVWAPPGRLTAMLRAKWGFNSLLPDHNYVDANHPKNRKDHRHHAIDAFVLACTDRGLLQRIARASGRAEDLDLDHLFPKDSFPKPYEGYRDDLAARLATIVVSHKPDHGLAPGDRDNVHVTSGQLHEETAYGLVDEEIDGKTYNLVTRKPIGALTRGEIDRVRDKDLRADLQQVAYEAEQSGARLGDALAAFGETRGIRRVRILKTEKSVRVVRHGDGFTKAYSPGDNHRIEIYALPDGEWAGEGVTVFDANQPGFAPEWRRRHPAARLVMRVHNGDLIEADFGNGRQIARVYRLEPSAKRVRLALHNEAGAIDVRHNDPDDPLRWIFGTYARLRAGGARRVRVDPIGRVAPAAENR